MKTFTTNQKTDNQVMIAKPFLSLEEASEYLGLSKATLYSYSHNRVLTYYKLRGRKLYFKKEDLKNFILNDNNLVKSSKQIESEALNHIISK